ncbi:MAG: SH3 domain-containing protein [Pirellulaceae bacterium]|nr:SH3 domain-containing protein [Pirellulaceae bacterium]
MKQPPSVFSFRQRTARLYDPVKCCVYMWIVIFAVGTSSLGNQGVAGEPERLLEQAIQEYRGAMETKERAERISRYHRAELLFARIITGDPSENGVRRGIRNADLFVNLGNAALGAERLGPAIWAYRNALLLDPDHHRATQNLDHARTIMPAWVPQPDNTGMLDTFLSWMKRMSAQELQLIAGISFLLTMALLASSIRWRRTAFRHLAMVPGIAWLLLVGMLTYEHFRKVSPEAVVIDFEVTARSADSPNAPARLTQPLPGGTEVKVIEDRNDWLRVRLYDGRDAWLPAASVQQIGS